MSKNRYITPSHSQDYADIGGTFIKAYVEDVPYSLPDAVATLPGSVAHATVGMVADWLASETMGTAYPHEADYTLADKRAFQGPRSGPNYSREGGPEPYTTLRRGGWRSPGVDIMARNAISTVAFARGPRRGRDESSLTRRERALKRATKPTPGDMTLPTTPVVSASRKAMLERLASKEQPNHNQLRPLAT